MEHGGGDKYVASHPAHCSLLVWFLCLVRCFMPSPVKLNTNTSPSASIFAIQDSFFRAIFDIGLETDDFSFSINNIGLAVEIFLSVGVMFVGFTSLGGAFISGCPFRSAFSDVIRLIFEKLQTLSNRITCGCFSSKRLRWLWIGTFTILWVASGAAMLSESMLPMSLGLNPGSLYFSSQPLFPLHSWRSRR